jgi:hypothetical protein
MAELQTLLHHNASPPRNTDSAGAAPATTRPEIVGTPPRNSSRERDFKMLGENAPD